MGGGGDVLAILNDGANLDEPPLQFALYRRVVLRREFLFDLNFLSELRVLSHYCFILVNEQRRQTGDVIVGLLQERSDSDGVAH